MLILSRKTGERVRIKLPDGQIIWVTVAEVDRHASKIRLGFEGARDIEFKREEIIDKPERDK